MELNRDNLKDVLKESTATNLELRDVGGEEAVLYLPKNSMSAYCIQDEFLQRNWVVTCVDNAIQKEGTKIYVAEAEIKTVEKTVEEQKITV